MQKMNKLSLFAFLLGSFFLAYSSLFYYPKWKVGEGECECECVLTWDVLQMYIDNLKLSSFNE